MGYVWLGEGLRVSCNFDKTDGSYMFTVVGDEERVDAFLTRESLLTLSEGLHAWVTAKEELDDRLGELAYTAYTDAANDKKPVPWMVPWSTVSGKTQQLWVEAAMAVRDAVLDEASTYGKAARDAT